MAWCLVYWTPILWVPGSMPGRKFIFPFFSFFTCVNRVIITSLGLKGLNPYSMHTQVLRCEYAVMRFVGRVRVHPLKW